MSSLQPGPQPQPQPTLTHACTTTTTTTITTTTFASLHKKDASQPLPRQLSESRHNTPDTRLRITSPAKSGRMILFLTHSNYHSPSMHDAHSYVIVRELLNKKHV
ncbi:hypothetical protein E2C01_102643 [Portunus trituberculatus]|uniref:Uncharacterized protein n=1 Tax=Portunus trituberculatus TaxID=210409 RepID=A0A5B7KIU4_PORTR|nr:hypothetical protein [Portunus trituberculatus]